ncbi:tRNA-dihydrouridine(16/17) synthase [NAD(P)(+)]-like [Danaus plexippus]|uniref:tRNA-dihydrouridine(16/17) synthase [NAD(P)(+)]-like n=1 Tax=Danaus plexippus TaxID=13037 RepID=UPI002AB25E0E|nr:tRNA-dihydrouridine(16/17) synthase [NAD(P)(+)]-like [Danaus plexippus]
MVTDPWEFWTSINSPKYVLAPMVNQSELAFRMLCRKYGVQLAYTPMLHSRIFSTDSSYRQTSFQTCNEDLPLVAQFCGNEVDTITRAVDYLDSSVAAVDINLGCPQTISQYKARKVVLKLQDRRKGEPYYKKLGWYNRYRPILTSETVY